MCWWGREAQTSHMTPPPSMNIHSSALDLHVYTHLSPPSLTSLICSVTLPSHSLLLFPVVCLWSLSSSALREYHFPFLSVISLSGLCCLAPSHGKAPSVFSQCSGLQNNPVWFPTLVFCLGFGIAASIHHNSPGRTECYNKASPDLQAPTIAPTIHIYIYVFIYLCVYMCAYIYTSLWTFSDLFLLLLLCGNTIKKIGRI